MLARCVHIDQELKYFDASNNEYILSPNETIDEGYCLTLNETNLNLQCNVYHGDLALIQLQPNLPETMFFCNCKNPGLIGNRTILGACDTPFICNGLVNNLNQPIENIRCKCENSQISTVVNNIPTCRRKTVGEASADNTLNDLNLSQNPDRMLANTIENFNSVVVNNINSDTLVNPCSYCPVTNGVISNMAIGTDDEGVKFCSINYTNFSDTNEIYGIPYRRSPRERILAGDNGPDGILGVWWYEVVIYTQLANFVQRMVFKFEYSPGNHDFYTQLNLDITKKYVIATDDLRLGLHLRVPPLDPDAQTGSRCLPRWPIYWCTWNQERETQYTINLTGFPDLEPSDGVSNRMLHAEVQRLGNNFFWGRESWNQMQLLNLYLARSQDGSYISHTPRYTKNQGMYAENVQMIAYGFRRSSKRGLWRHVVLNNGNFDDWQRVQNQIRDIN
jgi:hypothetical protein